MKCDDDPVPAKKRKPAKPPLVLDDDDEPMSQDDYDYEDDYEYTEADFDGLDTEFIGRSSVM